MLFELSPQMIAEWPPEAVAIIRALLERNAELEQQVVKLQKRVAELEAKLNKSSKNSSKPPSSAHPHAKPELPSKPKSKRKRGAQPGHDKFERTLIPTQDCETIVPCVPPQCRVCRAELKGTDPSPRREQVWDVRIIQVVTEYQLHRITCTCGVSTCGELPEHVVGRTGPMLTAMLVLLTSFFRISRRRAALFSSDICKVPCSPGHVSQLEARATLALKNTYNKLAQALPEQPNLSIDETPFKRGKVKTWLWTFVAASFTVFVLRPTRKATVLCETIGADFSGSINCDRAKMYFRFQCLQWCWAHLERDFQALIDSPDNQQKRLGHDMLREINKLFIEYAKCRDGTITFAMLQENLRPVRKQVEGLLLRGFGTAAQGMCKQLYTHKENLWTFLEDPNVDPTNNVSERSLRHGVIWRKLSYGTQSERGDRFVETLLSIIETCRQQNHSIIDYVTTALNPKSKTKLPPLLNTP